MHETSKFNSIITFSYTKYFVHSYTVDVVFTLSYYVLPRAHGYHPKFIWVVYDILVMHMIVLFKPMISITHVRKHHFPLLYTWLSCLLFCTNNGKTVRNLILSNLLKWIWNLTTIKQRCSVLLLDVDLMCHIVISRYLHQLKLNEL